MSILNINDLALELVARDFSNGHPPTNGGPTKTHKLLTGSRAINHGNNDGAPELDQRGLQRLHAPGDTQVDIGAFELGAITPPIVT